MALLQHNVALLYNKAIELRPERHKDGLVTLLSLSCLKRIVSCCELF